MRQEENVEGQEITQSIREVLTEELGPLVELDPPEGLMDYDLVLIPGKAGTKSKEVPMRALLRKMVLIRDRLRQVERIVNSSSLTDLDKIRLQVHVTRMQEALVALGGYLAR